MGDTSSLEEGHIELEARVSAEVNAAEFQAMNGLLKPLALQFYLERFPYLQIVDAASTIKDDISKVSFETSLCDWRIHQYGKVAMSASAGEFLFCDGLIDDGFRGEEITGFLRFRGEKPAPVMLYGFLGKILNFKIKFDNIEAQFDAKSHLEIPGLAWKSKLAEEAEQIVSLTPSKVGNYPIYYPDKRVCGHLTVLEVPKALPRHGTLMHQADITAKRMVQLAVEQDWEGIVVADGSQRMKLVAWVAAKALQIPIEGVDYNDQYDACFDRVMTHSSQHLAQLVKNTKVKSQVSSKERSGGNG